MNREEFAVPGHQHLLRNVGGLNTNEDIGKAIVSELNRLELMEPAKREDIPENRQILYIVATRTLYRLRTTDQYFIDSCTYNSLFPMR